MRIFMGKAGFLKLLTEMSGRSPQPVMIVSPGKRKSEVLDDFVQFLSSPDGRKILAKYGIYPSPKEAASKPVEAHGDTAVKQFASAASNRL